MMLADLWAAPRTNNLRTGKRNDGHTMMFFIIAEKSHIICFKRRLCTEEGLVERDHFFEFGGSSAEDDVGERDWSYDFAGYGGLRHGGWMGSMRGASNADCVCVGNGYLKVQRMLNRLMS
jgi:hypothetical protein